MRAHVWRSDLHQRRLIELSWCSGCMLTFFFTTTLRGCHRNANPRAFLYFIWPKEFCLENQGRHVMWQETDDACVSKCATHLSESKMSLEMCVCWDPTCNGAGHQSKLCLLAAWNHAVVSQNTPVWIYPHHKIYSVWKRIHDSKNLEMTCVRVQVRVCLFIHLLVSNKIITVREIENEREARFSKVSAHLLKLWACVRDTVSVIGQHTACVCLVLCMRMSMLF